MPRPKGPPKSFPGPKNLDPGMKKHLRGVKARRKILELTSMGFKLNQNTASAFTSVAMAKAAKKGFR